MTTTRRHRRVLALVATAAMVLLAGASCGGDDDDDAGSDPTTSESSATSSPPTTLSPEEEAEAVYLELVDVVYRLLTTNPDPDDPDLARLATDPVLSELQDNLATMQAEHQIVERGDLTHEVVQVVTVTSSTEATLTACSVGNDTTLDQDDGSIVGGPDVSARLLEVTLVRDVGAAWRVSDVSTAQIFAGATSCEA